MHTHKSKQIEDLPLQQVRISAMKVVENSAYVMRIPRCGDFLPGQVIGVTTTPSIPPRLYSLCSGTKDPYWEILFNIQSAGLLTPRLAEIRANHTVYVSMPFGSFIDDQTPSWWIAAGTGIAPFRSMLRSGLTKDKHLVHGARKPTEFYFADEFRRQLASRYVRCCSQGEGENLYAGRLTHWLEEQPNVPTDTTYLLCGSAEMVVQVRDILLSRGVTFGNIRSEIYF